MAEEKAEVKGVGAAVREESDSRAVLLSPEQVLKVICFRLGAWVWEDSLEPVGSAQVLWGRLGLTPEHCLSTVWPRAKPRKTLG